jgi:hypothetical protein
MTEILGFSFEFVNRRHEMFPDANKEQLEVFINAVYSTN